MQLDLNCQKCEESFSLELTELQAEPEIRCPGCNARAATGQIETLIEALDDLFAAVAPLRRKFQMTLEIDSEDLPPPYDEEPSVGKVKVALNLNDNSLAGQIYVENQTVKDVFQANLDGLLQSFRDGGFTNLSLQVSVGNGNGGGNAGQGQAQTAAQARDYGRQVAEVPVTEARAARIGSWNDRQINLTA